RLDAGRGDAARLHGDRREELVVLLVVLLRGRLVAHPLRARAPDGRAGELFGQPLVVLDPGVGLGRNVGRRSVARGTRTIARAIGRAIRREPAVARARRQAPAAAPRRQAAIA